MELTTNTAPLLIIRLGKKWKPKQEEIERGYFRAGQGWHPNLTDLELTRPGRWRLNRYNDHAHLAGLPPETPRATDG